MNLTALADVFFLLLLFFMLTSSFMGSSVLNLSINGNAATNSDSTDSPLMLVAAEGGRIFSGSKEISRDALPTMLSAEIGIKPSRRVVIMSTKGVTVQELVGLMDSVHAAGGTNVSLSNWE